MAFRDNSDNEFPLDWLAAVCNEQPLELVQQTKHAAYQQYAFHTIRLYIRLPLRRIIDPSATPISQRMGTIYSYAPGATNQQAHTRSLAEYATSNTTEEANDRYQTLDDSTAEDKYSNHNRTNLAPRQAPAWAFFTFRDLARS